ncbi:hypothetical protein [Pedobacter sp. SYSU D00535]|uniref:hypothetical protein n=1 Tax=Pedobacter sp. SYSU D00535 TaxID=2810308 RepID=UPI001A9788B3|nr:hypothetical protein [Pedobacter sp. SYSU D00535]
MKYITLLLFSVLVFSACSKDDEGRIPDVPVNFSAFLQNPSLSALNSAGGAVVINGYGVAGLILYKRADGAIVAYDRCSSVNPEQRCAVTLDNPNLTVTDPCSGAKFSLFDGAPVKAPAKRPLKQYSVSISNNSQLHVTN